jgi:methyl-accepting chemotaxis protein
MAQLADPEFPLADRESARNQISDRFERYENALKKFESFPLSTAEQTVVDDSHTNWKALRSLLEEGIRLSKENTPASTLRLQKLAGHDLFEVMNRLNAVSATMRKVLESEIEVELVATEARAHHSYLMTAAAVLIGLACSLIFSFAFGNALGKRLGLVAAHFSESVVLVKTQANEMASTSEGLSSSMTEQSQTLQSTSVAVHQISEMVRANAEFAQRSDSLANRGQEAAVVSKNSVTAMITSIDRINDSNARGFQKVSESNHQLSSVSRVIQEIGEKTKVINDIVFQTKLLSFNASVEAARAGEHGKGFAVVAEEIGNLATMSGAAARGISEMIGTGIASVEEVVSQTRSQLEELMRDSKSSVQESVVLADQCRQSIDQLVNNVTEMQKAVNQISSASAEQASGVADINRAISELETVTTFNRNLAGQSSSASQAMMENSKTLEESLNSLNQTVNGASAARAA